MARTAESPLLGPSPSRGPSRVGAAGAEEALREAYERERQMVERLQELDRVRTIFVSSVSHEIRTPLTSILGYLELLSEQQDNLNEGQKEFLEIIGRNSQRLLSLIEDLLVLSRIESGSFQVLKEPVDIRSLVHAACREVWPRMRAASHELELHTSDDVGSVLGDSEQLQRLLVNLLTNAVKFTPPGGRIDVRADRGQRGIVISISDSGIGIGPEDLAEIFTPFFRSPDAHRRAIPGTGLGLSIAKTIVEQHDGSIECFSEAGKGTTMIVRLPHALVIRDRGE